MRAGKTENRSRVAGTTHDGRKRISTSMTFEVSLAADEPNTVTIRSVFLCRDTVVKTPKNQPRQSVEAAKTCLCFPKAALADKVLHVSTPTLAIMHYAYCAYSISGFLRHQPTPMRRSPSCGYDDGGSDLFMVVKRTLIVVSQIPSESVQLRGLIGKPKMALVLAWQSL